MNFFKILRQSLLKFILTMIIIDAAITLVFIITVTAIATIFILLIMDIITLLNAILFTVVVLVTGRYTLNNLKIQINQENL